MFETLRSKSSQYAIGFALAVLLFGAARGETPVISAIDSNDVIALERLADTGANPDEKALAKGAALALRHQDSAASALLQPLAAGAGDRNIRAAAYLANASVLLRQSRFGEVYAAMAAAKALRAAPFSLDETQTMDFARVLAQEPAMAVSKPASGTLAVKRDKAGLARIQVSINGKAVDAVVDSGAGFSTITESMAKAMGVRVLERKTTVGGSAKDVVETRIGVADRLQVGDATLSHVVFVVLPDSALSFAGGAYTIEAIVGLPVFVALDRIELRREGGTEVFAYGRGDAAVTAGAPNLLLAGVEPIVLAGTPAGPLRLFIDTGATNTTLNASVARDYPALAAGGKKETARMAGAGGSSEDSDAITVPELNLTIGGQVHTLHTISMRSKPNPSRHGAIGQDLLRQGNRWSLDFKAMQFSISD